MKKKKGIAILWVLVLSSILIIISVTTVSHITMELRNTSRIASSAISFSHANSGLAWAKNHIAKNNNTNELGGTFFLDFDNDSTNDVEVIISDEGNSNFFIRSTGKNNDARRSIEYRISPLPVTTAELSPDGLGSDSALIKSDNNDSFHLSFSFEPKDANNQSFEIGLTTSAISNPAPEGTIKHITAALAQGEGGTKMKISTSSNVGVKEEYSETLSPLEIGGNYPAFRFIGSIRYIKNTAAIFRITGTNPDGSISCIGIVSVNLEQNEDFGNLNFLKLDIDSNGLPNYTYKAGDEDRGIFLPFIESNKDNGVRFSPFFQIH